MAKGNFSHLASLINATPVINGIISQIEAAFQNTLSRDGSSPNQMNASLDMNSNRILNLPLPVNDSEPLRRADLNLTGSTTYSSWLPAVTWTPRTSYTAVAPASMVKYSNALYVCTTTHTSGLSFDAAKWNKLVDANVVSIPATSGQVKYSDMGSPQPVMTNLGDRVRIGEGVIGKSTAVAGIDGTFTWGDSRWGTDYILRDADLGIHMPKGGYAIGMIGRSSDFEAGNPNFRVASGFGVFMVSDIPADVWGKYAEGGYIEVASASSGCTAVGIEIAIPNYGGPVPTSNPFQVNNLGYTSYLQIDCGGGSSSTKDSWPSSVGIAFTKHQGAIYKGIVFGSNAISGSNGASNVTTNMTTTAGSKNFTVADNSSLVPGMWISSGFPVGTTIEAVWSGNRCRATQNATSTLTASATIFSNIAGVAIELAPHHEIRWTRNTFGNRSAFIRDDTVAADPNGSIGLIFNRAGAWWSNTTTEAAVGGIDTSGRLFVGGHPVVGPRQTGWSGTWSGTVSDITSSFNTTTVTVSQLAPRVRAIEEALKTHGLIGV